MVIEWIILIPIAYFCPKVAKWGIDKARHFINRVSYCHYPENHYQIQRLNKMGIEVR